MGDALEAGSGVSRSLGLVDDFTAGTDFSSEPHTVQFSRSVNEGAFMLTVYPHRLVRYARGQFLPIPEGRGLLAVQQARHFL